MASLQSPTKVHLPKHAGDHDNQINKLKLHRKADVGEAATSSGKETSRRQQRAVRQPVASVADSVPARSLRRSRPKKAATSTAAFASVSDMLDARGSHAARPPGG